MKKEEIKVGDRVLVKGLFGGIFHAHIIAIKKGLFGLTYYATWAVNCDIGGHYRKAGKLKRWNIICKN